MPTLQGTSKKAVNVTNEIKCTNHADEAHIAASGGRDRGIPLRFRLPSQARIMSEHTSRSAATTLLVIIIWYATNILVLLGNKFLLSNTGFRQPVSEVMLRGHEQPD